MKKHEAVMYGFAVASILSAGFLLHKQTHTHVVSPLPLETQSAGQGFCHAVNNVPDPACNPGVINPAVIQTQVQDTTHSTICKKGWTATIRPTIEYTENLKRQSIIDYGYTDTNLQDYEEDHVISVELGGSPTDPKNLWAQPLADAKKKDTVETLVHDAICSGSITLQQGQAIFLERAWQRYYK